MSLLEKNGHAAFGIYLGYEKIMLGENAAPFLPPVNRAFLQKNRIDIVGITVDSLNAKQAQLISAAIKRDFPQIAIIWGGIHPSVEPEECIAYPYVDYICIGEGEYPMLELCQSFCPGTAEEPRDTVIKNIWTKKDAHIFRNGLRDYIDINTVDFSRKELLYTGVYTSRGCAGNCSFCMSPYLKATLGVKGAYFRNRRVDLVIEDIKQMRRANRKFLLKHLLMPASLKNKLKTLLRLFEYHYAPVRIKDDSFLLNKRWFFEFAEAFKRNFKRTGYICSARVPDITEKVVTALQESGCRMIILGFESGDEQYRNQILNKSVSDAQILKAAELLHNAHIPILGQWMIGMPGETYEQALKSIRMSLKIGDIPQVHIATPFPKTKMREHGITLGLIERNQPVELKSIYDDFTLVPKDQKNIFRLLYNIFKIQSLTIIRPKNEVFDRFSQEIKKLNDIRIGSLILDSTKET